MTLLLDFHGPLARCLIVTALCLTLPSEEAQAQAITDLATFIVANELDGPFPGLAFLEGRNHDYTGCALARVRLEAALARLREAGGRPPWGDGEHHITLQDQENLRMAGVVDELHADSVFVPARHDHFVISGDGVIACFVHGHRYGRPHARGELEQLGFSDPAILAMAWTKPPPAHRALFGPVRLVAYAIASLLVFWLYRFVQSRKTWNHRFLVLVEFVFWVVLELVALIVALRVSSWR